MASKHKQIHVLIDRELELEIQRFAAERGLSDAGAARFLMRAALQIPKSDRDAVWREVRSEMGALYRSAVERALSDIPPTLPEPKRGKTRS